MKMGPDGTGLGLHSVTGSVTGRVENYVAFCSGMFNLIPCTQQKNFSFWHEFPCYKYSYVLCIYTKQFDVVTKP
jgi:hypothetical protein